MSRVLQDFCENAELSEWGFAHVARVSEHPDTWNSYDMERVTCWVSPCCFSHWSLRMTHHGGTWLKHSCLQNLLGSWKLKWGGLWPRDIVSLKHICEHWTVVVFPSSGHNPAWMGLDFNSHILLTWEPYAVNCLCKCKDGLGLSCLRNGALFISQSSSLQEFT